MQWLSVSNFLCVTALQATVVCCKAAFCLSKPREGVYYDKNGHPQLEFFDGEFVIHNKDFRAVPIWRHLLANSESVVVKNVEIKDFPQCPQVKRLRAKCSEFCILSSFSNLERMKVESADANFDLTKVPKTIVDLYIDTGRFAPMENLELPALKAYTLSDGVHENLPLSFHGPVNFTEYDVQPLDTSFRKIMSAGEAKIVLDFETAVSIQSKYDVDIDVEQICELIDYEKTTSLTLRFQSQEHIVEFRSKIGNFNMITYLELTWANDDFFASCVLPRLRELYIWETLELFMNVDFFAPNLKKLTYAGNAKNPAEKTLRHPELEYFSVADIENLKFDCPKLRYLEAYFVGDCDLSHLENLAVIDAWGVHRATLKLPKYLYKFKCMNSYHDGTITEGVVIGGKIKYFFIDLPPKKLEFIRAEEIEHFVVQSGTSRKHRAARNFHVINDIDVSDPDY